MKLYYDIHIHSAASHCGDKNMRPNAIALTAKKNGLDVISVVDHVSGANLKAAANAAKKFGLLFLPGIEVTTKKGIHMLCYFKSLKTALEFSTFIYDGLPDVKNNVSEWGHQYIIDENDDIVGEIEKGLSQYTPHDVWQLIGLVESYGGLIVPAHINRDTHGLLLFHNDISKFGFNTVEIKKTFSIDKKHLQKTKVIYNSDAHVLNNIAKKTHYIEVNEKSIDAVFDYLKY